MATETYVVDDGKDRKDVGESSPPRYGDHESVQTDQVYAYDDSQKLGYTGTVFVILNKMIGTGSKSTRPEEEGSE